MTAVIGGIGSGYIFVIAPTTGFTQQVGGVVITGLSLATFYRCVLKNPGILSAERRWNGGDIPEQNFPSTGTRRCNVCDIVQPKGTLHCEFCDVCISEWDHHCPWTSKCIGAGNLNEFYTFLCVNLSSVVIICFATVRHTKHVHPQIVVRTGSSHKFPSSM
mmetsp:Transcript_67324/g.154269  ORF Transcript_67324/g.154269 Transcript_67324/m.154269 type:complete len:161 (+) Transcript_67324:337-819(+)